MALLREMETAIRAAINLNSVLFLSVMPQKIAQGAEAVLYKDNNVVKKVRVSKTYRHPTLDAKLRKFRAKREAKFLERLHEIEVRAPHLLSFDEKSCEIDMEFVKGKLLKECLESNYPHYANELGKIIATLHKNNLIHGDLTTSNMVVDGEIILIDFGLSFFSEKIEDKAVDLHLFKQALESKHYKIYEDCFRVFVESYKKNYSDADAVLLRLERVEQRGRYKEKY